jgi:CDP-paratose 2-epimerase
MKYLITGGCGFIGSNLAASIKKKVKSGCFDNEFISSWKFYKLKQKKKGEFKYYPFDINLNDIETVIKEEQPDVVFQLAGQVAMTTSNSNQDWIF